MLGTFRKDQSSYHGIDAFLNNLQNYSGLSSGAILLEANCRAKVSLIARPEGSTHSVVAPPAVGAEEEHYLAW